jgi:hypothetical protein
MADINNDFWTEFSKVQKEIRGESPSSDAMDHVLECLRKVDRRLYYPLGSRDTVTDLILSADGYPDLMPVLQKLKATAPSLDGWGIVVGYEGMLVLGERNLEVFPETENGDVLFRMALNGDHLWISRSVNFSVVFPNLLNASNFAASVGSKDRKSKINKYDGAKGFSHEVEVTINIVATNQAITDFENYLGSIAMKFGGRNDGWGCFTVKE